jgi:hypothetical protein
MTVPAESSATSTSSRPSRLEPVRRAYRSVMRPLRKPLPSGTSFATPAPTALFGWGAFALIVLANVYAMVRSLRVMQIRWLIARHRSSSGREGEAGRTLLLLYYARLATLVVSIHAMSHRCTESRSEARVALHPLSRFGHLALSLVRHPVALRAGSHRVTLSIRNGARLPVILAACAPAEHLPPGHESMTHSSGPCSANSAGAHRPWACSCDRRRRSTPTGRTRPARD